MRTNRYAALLAAAVLSAGVANAGTTVVTDQPAALLVYPGIVVLDGDEFALDTLIQISNTSSQPVAAKCYYVDAVGRCSVSGGACAPAAADFGYDEGVACPSSADVCTPQWVETDFRIYITAEQPLAWLVSEGMPRDAVPVDGIFRQGPNGESNAGTHIPPFGTISGGSRVGLGELKCYAINPDGTPSERNVLKGEMTIVSNDIDRNADVMRHNAIGHRAIAGANDGDNQLVLGGPSGEYDGCPNVLVVDHFFDGAENPVTGDDVYPYLVLVPCTENFVTQEPSRVTVQYLVFNEFEQRFSTSKPVDCFFLEEMASIDTRDASRSIFSAGVAGTLTGQTRLRPVEGGLVGWASELHGENNASFNIHQQGERSSADVITVVQ